LKLSVIMTTYNRAGHLRRGLYLVLNQEVKPDEVIIVDDGSTDSTRAVVEDYQRSQEVPIKYIYNRNFGYKNSCLAKNIGIKQATGDLLIFTEPEVLHIGEVISAHLQHHTNPGLFVSSGTVYFVFAGIIRKLTLGHFKKPKTILDIQPIIEWEEGYFPQPEDIAVLRKVNAPYCASCWKEDLMKINGFDERYLPFNGYEDVDLLSRLSRVGVQTISDEDIQLIHLAHGYTGCFENQHYNKKLNEDPNKPIVANQNIEWGRTRE